MNKIARKFLVAAVVALVGGSVDAATCNKTHFQPRPAGVNLAMEQVKWHTQINKPMEEKEHKNKHHNKKDTKAVVKETKEKSDKFGGSLVATGFYSQSTNNKGLGKYFGFNDGCSCNTSCNSGCSSSSCGNCTTVGQNCHANTDFSGKHFIHHPHDWLGHTETLSEDISLKYQYSEGGVKFDYYQDLDGFIEGLYFKLNAPIVWSQVKTTLCACDTAVKQVVMAEGSPEKCVSDYFCCGITQTGEATQKALAYAKICTGNKSKTSLADIDFILGWNFWETHKHHAGINIGVTFPTSPESNAEYLFYPMGGGNGKHWGLGAGFDVKVRPWDNDKDQNIELLFIMNYRYLFRNTECRTLGYTNNSCTTGSTCCSGCTGCGTCVNWGQYFLVGKTGVAGVQPFANISTRKVNVTPGSQIDGLAGFAYNNGGFTFDLGYNIYWREKESVKLSNCACIEKDTYGLAGYNYNATIVFAQTYIPTADVTANCAKVYNTGAWLTDDNLCTCAAAHPSYLSHKIYAGVGYSWDKWNTPLMLALGGEYEFASNNAALEKWNVFGKIGVSF